MFNCKGNFEKLYSGNSFCTLCKICRDSQSHLFDCYVLKNSVIELRVNQTVKYEHIFENNDYQVEAIRLVEKIISNRSILQEIFVKNL